MDTGTHWQWVIHWNKVGNPAEGGSFMLLVCVSEQVS